ncbi:hypothetical protein C9439_02840 [archaeon SCG-AAA382B04]|nr:hypothetical protein C9439_02840 [archaeon SCG-AAA382B04]
MKLVIDTNILMSSLMKEGKTREIILGGEHDLLSPDFLRREIKKHEDLILDKSNLSQDEFEILLTLLLEEIEVVHVDDYEDKLSEVRKCFARFKGCSLSCFRNRRGLFNLER